MIVTRGISKDDRIEAIQSASPKAKDCIAASQVNMAKLENRHRRDLSFSVGDFVSLSSAKLRLHFDGTKKLTHKYFGPFKVLLRVGHDNYELETPASMQVHETFYISSFKLHRTLD